MQITMQKSFIVAAALALIASPVLAQQAPAAGTPQPGASQAGAAPAGAPNAPKPADTEVWEPVPKVVTPGQSTNTAPPDAIVLFDGKNLDQWVTARTSRRRSGPSPTAS